MKRASKDVMIEYQSPCKRPVNRTAIAAFICAGITLLPLIIIIVALEGGFGLPSYYYLLYFLVPLGATTSIANGARALFQISDNKSTRYRGKWMAITALIIGLVFLLASCIRIVNPYFIML